METRIDHHIATVNGVRLHYVTAGSGEPLVLLHGWPQSWREWRHIIPALATRFTVIAPDMRGFGDSEAPTSGYDKRTVAADIHALVQHLGFTKISLVGHDIGMMVAYAYASAYPDEVMRLVVLEASLPGFGLEALHDSAKHPHLWHFGFFRASGVAEALISGKEKAFITHFIRTKAYNPFAVAEEDLNYYAHRLSVPGTLRGSLEHYRAFGTDAAHNLENARSKLQMPILAIGGSHSIGSQVGKIMEPLGKNVETAVIERSGHWIPEEQPEALIELLMRFLTEGD